MSVCKRIESLKQQIRLREIADDGYYISRQYKEDCQLLHELTCLLKKEDMSD